MATAKKTDPATDVASLFGDVELESTRVRNERRKVDVPAEVLAVLQNTQGANQRAIYAVRDMLSYETMADVFYSAGDILNAGVTVQPRVKEDGKFRVATEEERKAATWGVTHVSVKVGKKRGRPAASTSDASK